MKKSLFVLLLLGLVLISGCVNFSGGPKEKTQKNESELSPGKEEVPKPSQLSVDLNLSKRPFIPQEPVQVEYSVANNGENPFDLLNVLSYRKTGENKNKTISKSGGVDEFNYNTEFTYYPEMREGKSYPLKLKFELSKSKVKTFKLQEAVLKLKVTYLKDSYSSKKTYKINKEFSEGEKEKFTLSFTPELPSGKKYPRKDILDIVLSSNIQYAYKTAERSGGGAIGVSYENVRIDGLPKEKEESNFFEQEVKGSLDSQKTYQGSSKIEVISPGIYSLKYEVYDLNKVKGLIKDGEKISSAMKKISNELEPIKSMNVSFTIKDKLSSSEVEDKWFDEVLKGSWGQIFELMVDSDGKAYSSKCKKKFKSRFKGWAGSSGYSYYSKREGSCVKGKAKPEACKRTLYHYRITSSEGKGLKGDLWIQLAIYNNEWKVQMPCSSF